MVREVIIWVSSPFVAQIYVVSFGFTDFIHKLMTEIALSVL